MPAKHVNKAVNRARNRYSNGGQSTDGKICPFMSNGDKKVECTLECQLYKQNSKSQQYACPLTELNDIAFSLKFGG